MMSVHGSHCTDIKTLTEDDPSLLEKARPAFQKYNEDQMTTVKLSGSGKNVRTVLHIIRKGQIESNCVEIRS